MPKTTHNKWVPMYLKYWFICNIPFTLLHQLIDLQLSSYWCITKTLFEWASNSVLTPNLPLRYRNASLGSGLVNMLAIYSFVWTYSNMISLSYTNSLTKWYFIAICLVLKCMTRFFKMLIALVLSQNMTAGSLISTVMPSNNFLNQTMLEQFTIVAT